MDSITKKQLKMLVRNDYWGSVTLFMEHLFEIWQKTPIKSEDEFNTLWNVAKREGKIEGVKEFINSLEEIAND